MSAEKRKKNYFHAHGGKKHKQFILEPGMKGFLCTCNFSEKECIRDAYKILNEFADKIYGPDATKDVNSKNTESVTEKDDSSSITEQNVEEDDISTALNKEINELKAESSKPVNARRFQVVDTGVKNVIFIRSTLANPLELATKITTELDKTKQQRTRFLLRLLPIEVVCKANMNDIKSKANAMLEQYFAQEPKTFSIVFNRHSNHDIRRDEVIEDLAEIISKKNPGNKADLKNPELAVVIEVIRGLCLMAVAPNYYKFKKYNLVEICNKKGLTENEGKKENPSMRKDKEEENPTIQEDKDKSEASQSEEAAKDTKEDNADKPAD